MKENSRKKLNESVAILNRLHFKNENIMVVGSVALDMLGLLPDSREVNDVDFLLKTDEQTWRCMRLLEAIGNDCQKETYPGTDECLVFKFGDLKLNVWRTNDFDSTLKDSVTGIFVSTAKSTIEKKKRYNRVKDYNDLSNICKNIL